MKKGHPLLTLLVLSGLLILACGGLELIARASYQAHPLVATMPFLEDDPILLWKLKPNLSEPLWAGKPMQTNASGLRDAPVEPQKEGTLRILSLGESTTWGHGVDAQQTYTEQLAAMLNKPERPVDAINAGVPAWSLWQSRLFLEQQLDTLQPDLVLLYHLQNDLLPRGAGNPRDPFQVRLTDRQLSDARRPLAPLMKSLAQSRLRQWLWFEFLNPLLLGGTPDPNARDITRVPDADRKQALADIAGWCMERGIVLVVLRPVYGRDNYGIDTLLEEATPKAHGIEFLDLRRLKMEQNVPDTGFFQLDDAHPTPAGHRWIAEQLAAFLSLP
jgi:lysophospholipase L1-like esterase